MTPHPSTPKSLRYCRHAALLLGLAWTVAAAGSPLEDIKTAALEAAAQAEASREQLQWGGEHPLELYLACGDAALSVISTEADDDGTDLGHARFGPLEQRALSGGGWYHLAQLDRQAAHRIHVAVTLRADGDDAQAEPRRLEADLSTPAEASAPLVAVVDRGVIGAPSLRLLSLHATAARPGLARRLLAALPTTGVVQEQYLVGGPFDPVLRHALFLRNSHQYLEAAARLRRYGDSAGGALDPHYALAMAQADLDLGLAAPALALQPRWPGDDEAAVRRLRRDIAAWYYRRGDYPAAEDALGPAPPRRRKADLLAWQDAEAQILLAQGRMSDALAVLRAAEPQADYAGYVRYFNLGIAEVASGNVLQGLTVLDRVGDIASSDAALNALRDRANLVAGAHFLRQGQGATAIPLLEKVRDRGADSNTALLDLGWAWLAPAGVAQNRSMLGDERTVGVPPESQRLPGWQWDQNQYQRFKLDPFERAKLERGEDERLRHTLSIWGELASRPAPDDTVMEANLAIAVKLDQAGALKSADDYYGRAIAALEQSLSDLSQAEGYLVGAGAQADLYAAQAGQGFDRDLHNLPPMPTAYYLRPLLADWPFVTRLADYRDALVLNAQLGGLIQSLQALREARCGTEDAAAGNPACADLPPLLDTIGALQPRLAAAIPDLLQQLQQPLLQSLAERRRWQTRLLGDTRLALARLHDRPAHDAPP